MRNLFSLPALVVVMAAFSWEPAAAGIYTFEDAHGVRHFTNRPSAAPYAGMRLVGFRREPRTNTPRQTNPGKFKPMIDQAARETGMDPLLLRAVIQVESNYDPLAVSRRGAAGLMQLMPQTALRYGVADRFDPAQNILGGARYLRELLGKYDNDLILTLAAYNAGEDAVARYGNYLPPYGETWSYVPRVLELYRRHKPASETAD